MNEEQKNENQNEAVKEEIQATSDQAEKQEVGSPEPEKTEEIKEEQVESSPEPEVQPEQVAEEVKEVVQEEKAEEVQAVEELEEDVKEEKKEEETAGERRWYVIQTYSGQEEKVQKSVQAAIEKQSMQHKIFQILVPTEETIEIKGSKRIEKIKKMFPGYVFVEMILDDESWYAIRQTPGVSRFIGSKTRPTPVMDREMQRVLKQLGVKGEKLEITFDVGEAIRVISGPFRGYTGSVNEINQDKGKLKVLINIFGRDTPVEVNFEHAEKIS